MIAGLMNRPIAAALFIVSITLAACGSPAPSNQPAPSASALAAPASPSGSAGGQSSAPSSTAAPASAAASAPASAVPSSPVPSSVPSPAASGGAVGVADLRTLLPDSIGGHKLTKTQFSGKDLANSGAVSQQMVDLLASIGRKPEDLTVATADDPTHGTDLNITAFRVNGIAVGTFLESYLPVVHATFPDGSITQGTRAGRSVYTVVGQPATPPQVLLPTADILFAVTSATPELVDEALTKLP
jgi:hypothetical protein